MLTDLDDASWTRRPTARRGFRSPAAAASPAILGQLKPDPARDDVRELMAATGLFRTTPESVAYLVRLGANVNDRPDGGSTVLD
jgi:hypothetical protein